VLEASAYPGGFADRPRALYRPESRQVVVDCELPPQSVIPVKQGFKYVQRRGEMDAIDRPVKEIKDRPHTCPI